MNQRLLTAKVITKNRAQVTDCMFLCKITHDEFTPEYNGFNTDEARTQGYSVKPSNKQDPTDQLDQSIYSRSHGGQQQ